MFGGIRDSRTGGQTYWGYGTRSDRVRGNRSKDGCRESQRSTPSVKSPAISLSFLFSATTLLPPNAIPDPQSPAGLKKEEMYMGGVVLQQTIGGAQLSSAPVQFLPPFSPSQRPHSPSAQFDFKKMQSEFLT